MTEYFEGGEPIELIGVRGRLMNELVWTDHLGYRYHVPAGYVYDGASIPEPAWSLVGHPFMRGFRRPAALHDYLCETRQYTSSMVHHMFYRALRAEGVIRWKAWLIYLAVSIFGPKW